MYPTKNLFLSRLVVFSKEIKFPTAKKTTKYQSTNKNNYGVKDSKLPAKDIVHTLENLSRKVPNIFPFVSGFNARFAKDFAKFAKCNYFLNCIAGLTQGSQRTSQGSQRTSQGSQSAIITL